MQRRNLSAITNLSGKVRTYAQKAAAEAKVAPRRKRTKYKSQERLTVILESIFGCTAETEKTFPWLISPKGAHLRIDIYFASINLAVEYHGKQHETYPNAFHKTADDFRYAAMCDAWKISTLKQRGVKVLEFTHKDKLTRNAVFAKLKKASII